MKEILKSPFRKYFLIGLSAILIASWFSLGFQQMDEHFMILEYANYKFGLVPASEVPWEYTEKVRPCLQPTIAYYTFRLFKSIGIHDPFFHVFILRMLSGMLAWFVSCKLALSLTKTMRNADAQKWTLLAFSCLWFFAYIHVRFSSENMAGICFAGGLLCIPGVFTPGIKTDAPAGRWILAGLLFGLSFYFRFQIAFAILGILLWLLFYSKSPVRSYSFLLCGALVAIIVNTWIDQWFYGEWVLSPYRYFESNILHDAASMYGTTPWYDYFILFLTQGIPPLSWIFLVLFFIGIYKYPRHIFVFIVIPFLLGHMMVPHKEFRFLFPITLPFLGLCFLGLDAIWPQIAKKKWLKPSLRILVVFNLALLAYRSFWPAKANHLYYKFLYTYAAEKPRHLYTLGRGIFDEGYNVITLYRHPNLREDTLTEQAYAHLLEQEQPDSLLIMSYQAKLPIHNARYTEELVYVNLPRWVVNIELNDWQSRSDIWSLWMLRKKHP